MERVNFQHCIGCRIFIFVAFAILLPTTSGNLMITPGNWLGSRWKILNEANEFACSVYDPNDEIAQKYLTHTQWWYHNGTMILGSTDDVRIWPSWTDESTVIHFKTKAEGTYKCTALYKETEKLSADLIIRENGWISFDDCPMTQIAVKGQDYKIRCWINPKIKPNYDWKIDNHMLASNANYTLIIRGVTEDHERLYTCRVRVMSMESAEERHIQLIVHEHPWFPFPPEYLEVVESGSITFFCDAIGVPIPEYQWFNQKNQNISDLERHTVDKYRGTLTIDDVQKEDAGIYTCMASNSVGNISLNSTLDVLMKPVIYHYQNITTQLHGNALIVCRASGDPAPDIRFQKVSNQKMFPTGASSGSRIFTNQRNSGRNTLAYLRISNISRTDGGLYLCIANNSRTKAERHGHITVEFPPIFLNNAMREAWSFHGHPVNLTCSVEAIPNATISWNFEGDSERSVDLSSEDIVQTGFHNQSTLEIQPMNKSYFGFYKCVASNKLGTAELRVQLTEAKKPGPIQEAKIYAKTSTSLAYNIVGPADNGGFAVKKIVAQYIKDDSGWEQSLFKNWTASHKVFVIDSLIPMTSYSVRFAAENEVGLGNWTLDQTETTRGINHSNSQNIVNMTQSMCSRHQWQPTSSISSSSKSELYNFGFVDQIGRKIYPCRVKFDRLIRYGSFTLEDDICRVWYKGLHLVKEGAAVLTLPNCFTEVINDGSGNNYRTQYDIVTYSSVTESYTERMAIPIYTEDGSANQTRRYIAMGTFSLGNDCSPLDMIGTTVFSTKTGGIKAAFAGVGDRLIVNNFKVLACTVLKIRG